MRTTRLYSRAEALVESRRCLGCYDAPCMQSCPAGVNIPGFIRRLREENFQGAGLFVYEACPLSVTCGMACPSDTLCESACVLKNLGQTPVRISALQAFAASQYRKKDEMAGCSTPARVAVIGAGPSGLGCAVQLVRFGHQVHVFDGATSLSGLVDRVIPAHRLPHEMVELDLQRIRELPIDFHLGEKINFERASQLVSTHDAVYLAAGLSGENPFDIQGSDLPGVISAMQYLGQARSYIKGESSIPETGRVVAVIGGGNVALDSATVAKRLGAERVIVLYRRTREQMPGWKSEYLEAAALGVEFRWLTIVEEVLGNGKRVTGVRLASMRLGDAGVDGRRKVEPDPQAGIYLMQCDQVIHALGQALDSSIFQSLGLPIDAKGRIAVDPLSHQVGETTIFAGGECVSGGSTIVSSMSQGMQSARAIHQWWLRRAGE